MEQPFCGAEEMYMYIHWSIDRAVEVVGSWKQLRCPSLEEWIHKIWCRAYSGISATSSGSKPAVYIHSSMNNSVKFILNKAEKV